MQTDNFMTQFNMAKTKSDTLHVQGINVGIYTEDYPNEYISLTDIARFRNSEDPRFAIQNWMRNRTRLSSSVFGRVCITPILTVCNSTRLELSRD